MQQLVRVQKCNDDGTAQVLLVRQSACSGDCHQCSGCGAAQETMLITACNPIGARPGQVVTIESATGPVLAAAAIMYLMPLLLFFLGYLLGTVAGSSGALWGGIAFALGVVLAVVYDRLVARKQKNEYTIIGFGKVPGTKEKRG